MFKIFVTNNLWFIFEYDILFWIYLYLWNIWPNILCLYLCEIFPTESTWSVFVSGYFLHLLRYFLVFVRDISDRMYLVCICVSIFVFLWDISDRMYLVWVVMHLLMGTICAGGRLSASSPLTPTNFTRSNCLDFLWFFLATDNPKNFLY